MSTAERPPRKPAARALRAAPPASRPVFYLLAGPNGAGKSTLYKALAANGTVAPDIEFVNADLHEAAHLQHIADPQARSEAARAWAEARRATLLAQRQSFVSETVFSHPSKLALLQEAQAAGFLVVLIVVALDDPQLLLERVRRRVCDGVTPCPTRACWHASHAPWRCWHKRCGRCPSPCSTLPKRSSRARTGWWPCVATQ